MTHPQVGSAALLQHHLSIWHSDLVSASPALPLSQPFGSCRHAAGDFCSKLRIVNAAGYQPFVTCRQLLQRAATCLSPSVIELENLSCMLAQSLMLTPAAQAGFCLFCRRSAQLASSSATAAVLLPCQ